MFGELFKLCLAFTASFIFLSYPVNEKPLFYHLDKVFAPYTKKAIARIQVGVKEAQSFGKQLFQNSNPEKNTDMPETKDEIENRIDRINTSFSARERKKLKALEQQMIKEHEESHSDRDIQALNNLIIENN